ncbi:uncharacterized membrane protein YhaH (DUF805 family) [Weissella uvarum]|uniref:DUF805 domain-containing protein n=1 Tax=Weissella uvarum TaxID=1479233 RepID=UPI0019601917|nr:DUF805 domain-containing protein [Weissella uvarum]MBM7616624.1 uncharacterized membrane protein YhaH (DUF805 family) [Weissella uvarum]MCM0594918.1 DUF805 domain-containing protein [Weissella uvarum]
MILQDILNYWKKMFNYNSRISRTEFFVGSIVNAILGFLTYYILAYVLGFIGGLTDADLGTLEAIVLFLVVIFWVLYTLAGISALNRRLRDAGFNPWWTVANFFPVLQLVPFAMSFFPSRLPKKIQATNRTMTRT